jgi:hypothetical protein
MNHSQNIPLRSSLEGLLISSQELDQVINLRFSDELAIALAQAIAHKNLKQLLSVILTEVFILSVLLILLLPISFIVLRRFQLLPNSLPNHPLYLTLVSVIGLAGLLWIVFVGNKILWRRARSLRGLAQLIHQVHQFNRLVNSLLLLGQERLPSSTPTNRSRHREEVIGALGLTRDTLLNAFSIEKLYRTQPSLVTYSDTVATLEHHLTTLMTFGLHEAIDEYTPLLDEILQININVHRELSKLER